MHYMSVHEKQATNAHACSRLGTTFVCRFLHSEAAPLHPERCNHLQDRSCPQKFDNVHTCVARCARLLEANSHIKYPSLCSNAFKCKWSNVRPQHHIVITCKQIIRSYHIGCHCLRQKWLLAQALAPWGKIELTPYKVESTPCCQKPKQIQMHDGATQDCWLHANLTAISGPAGIVELL